MNKVIKFSAKWCGPCQVMAPVFKQFQELHQKDSVEILEVDVDANYDTASLYNIRSIPTTLFVRDNNVVDTVKGVADLMKLNQAYENAFRKSTTMA